MAGSASSAAGVTWNLSDLFAGPDDPAIEATLRECAERAEQFASTYRGTIAVANGPTPSHLLAGLRDMEAIYDRIARVGYYASLLYSADTASHANRALRQMVEERNTALRNTLLFFDLEWLSVDDESAARLVSHPDLAEYRHYLTKERAYKPHTLSEPEERIINEKDVTGSSAWSTLFTEVTSSLTFPVERDGETRQLTLSETLALSHEPDRDLRRRAHDALFGVLERNEHILTFTYDTLILDKKTMDRLRSYPDPMAARHLSNELDASSVDRMMEVVEQNYGVAHSYFRLKAKLIDLPKLMIYDQYAPVGSTSQRFEYSSAQETILDALGRFSPRFREVAGLFFDRRWIDAELRPGKRGGAFCASVSPELHPYILCNYTDNLRDVMTVAHELGHGLHGFLSLGLRPVNYHPTLPMAETASVFAEMLVFDHLVNEISSPADRLALICGKVEDAFATVFRQNVLTRFEQAAFDARNAGRLTSQRLCDAWIEANAPYYGEALQMTDGYRWGWSYIPHFIHTPFYCYSYVFGELLVLALYGMYREQGEAFVPEYTRLLSRGGSATPSELLAPLGVDFRDPDFWQRGFRELRRLVDWASSLANQIRSGA